MKTVLKIFITGSNGFVGTNLVERLMRFSDHEIIAFILKDTPKGSLEKLGAEYDKAGDRLKIVEGDILDKGGLIDALNGVDVVVHLAGIVTDWAPEELYEKINVKGTQNLLEAASENGVNRFIFMSSLTVHAMEGHNYSDENYPRNMRKMAYGRSKIKAERLIEDWASYRGVFAGDANPDQKRSYAIIRPGFIIYGPYDQASFILALDAIASRKFALINGGKAMISYVYVKNLVYGIQLLIEASDVSGPYILLDGNISWKDWVNTWIDALGINFKVKSVPYSLIAPIAWLMEKSYRLFRIKKSPPLTMYRIGIPRKDLAFSNAKAMNELNYKPPYDFSQSIHETIEYYQNWKEANKARLHIYKSKHNRIDNPSLNFRKNYTF